MHLVSANYTLPTVLSTLQTPANVGTKTAAGAKATTRTTGTTGTSSTTSSTTSSSSSSDSISSTFLSLLSTELQNQDPTAPVDSTAMVGQMISLNQLDQLISINQAVTGDNTGTTGLLQKPAAAASDTAGSSANGGLANTLSPSVAGAAVNQLPFDPNTLMPLGPGTAGALGSSINSSLNPTSTGFSTANHSTSGGNK
jgi:flagellar basal-body rod modification protein FlgD